MQQQQKCSQCFQVFTILNPPRLMPLCEHNVCTKCLKDAVQNKQDFIECGFCSKKIKKREIKLFPKNLKLMDRIKTLNSIQNKSLAPKIQKTQEDETSLTKSPQLVKQDEQLLLTEQKDDQKEEQDGSICVIHNKPYEIICATQRKRICCHCAIFGDHKQHRFRTFLEFQNEIVHKIQQMNVIQQKRQEFEEENNLVNLRKQLTNKFNETKSVLISEIQNNFNELIEKVKNHQKTLILQAENNFRLALEKINQQLSNQLKLKKTYLNWQSQCQQVINKLKMTRNPKSRIEIYYDSPLEICQQGQIYLQDMIEKLKNLKTNTGKSIESITVKKQDVDLNTFVTFSFPLLEKKLIEDEIAHIQNSFQMDFPSKILLPTKEDLQQNSFLFESEMSAIQIRDSNNQKFQIKNRLNKSVTSINSIKNIEAIFGSMGGKAIKTKTTTFMSKETSRDKKRQNKTLFGRTRSPTQKRFGSPDALKSPPIKEYKTPEQILIGLASNDLINEIDLSDFSLSDRQILNFLKQAKSIRVVKAIKLQKNLLTDEGLQCICPYLEHVSNLNLSFNRLTDRCLQVLIRNKDYLYKMRIVNLAENRLTKDRTDVKIKGKLQELKKMGIVVSL